jgi:hypothetical protein
VTPNYDPIRVGQWFQGPTGSGQGGWTAQRLEAAIGEPVTIAIRRPIPLEVDLIIIDVGQSWHLVDPTETDQPVLIASRWDTNFADTEPVSVAAAADARTRFPLHEDHPVPVCFSCGEEPDSMQVHSGALTDGRWATDWQVPTWAVDDDGTVDAGALWAAIDCAQAWYAGNADGRRHFVTVQLAVEQLAPLKASAAYALVAWQGTYPRAWDGRKRGAGGAAFAADGTCVARSSSFWIAP